MGRPRCEGQATSDQSASPSYQHNNLPLCICLIKGLNPCYKKMILIPVSHSEKWRVPMRDRLWRNHLRTMCKWLPRTNHLSICCHRRVKLNSLLLCFVLHVNKWLGIDTIFTNLVGKFEQINEVVCNCIVLCMMQMRQKSLSTSSVLDELFYYA